MLIQAALNGSTSRSEHPAVPRTPAELAASAREAQAAGATAFHIHPRDSTGAQTLLSRHVLAAVAAVREAAGLPVSVTTGIWTVDGEPGRRLALVADWAGESAEADWPERPGESAGTGRPGQAGESAGSGRPGQAGGSAGSGRSGKPGGSVRAGWSGKPGGSAGAGWSGKHSRGKLIPDLVSINMNEPGIEALADLVTSLGIGIEAGVWTVDDARRLGTCSFRDRVVRVLLEPVDRVPADAVASASETSAELRRLGIDAPQMHHGYGLATWEVLRSAVAGGFDIRIGLEDTTVLPDGAPPVGNGDLVAAAASLARQRT